MEMNLLEFGCLGIWIYILYIQCQSIQLVNCQSVPLTDADLFVKYERYVPRASTEPEPRLNHDIFGQNSTLGHFYSLANNLTGLIVLKSKPVPDGYITEDGNDIDHKVLEDDWLDYLRQQHLILVVVLTSLLFMIFLPIMGICYCLICFRGRRTRMSTICTCICWGIMLTVLVIFMLFALIFAMLSSVQLEDGLSSLDPKRKCLPKNSRESPNTAAEVVRSTSEHLHHLHVENYKQFQRRIEQFLQHEPSITQSYVQMEANGAAIDSLSKVMDNLQNIQFLFAKLKDEVPKARRLATQFRDALRNVKRSLLMELTSECSYAECRQFYRAHDISYLDMGCLHFDILPDADVYVRSIQTILRSHLADYPRNASRHLRQLSSAIKNHMNELISTIQEDVNDGGHQLKSKSDMTNEVLERLVEDLSALPTKIEPKSGNGTQLAGINLRNKLGTDFLYFILGLIGCIMLVPLLILFSFVVYMCSATAARHFFCCILLAIFLLFFLAMLLTLFFFVHGALLHHAFCSGEPDRPVPNNTLNPNRYLPVRFALTQPLPQLRADEILTRCQEDENLYKLLQLEDLFNLDGLREEVIEDVEDCLHQMENSSLPIEFGEMHAQAETVIEYLLHLNNLSGYDSTRFTKYLCRQLVPEPYPGPLPELWTSLHDLAMRLNANASLRNQVVHLQAFHHYLGVPLAKIVNHMLDMLKQIDDHLSGGSTNFAQYMQLLLSEIRKGEDFLKLKAKEVVVSMGRNLVKYVDDSLAGYIGMVENVTANDLSSCSILMRGGTQNNSEQASLCSRIVKPMNGIWFGVLMCSLLFVPAICCIHLMRSNLKRSYYYSDSEPSIITEIEEEYVPPGRRDLFPPVPLPGCYCNYHVNLPMVPETNVDLLPMDIYENVLVKPKRE